MRAEDGMVDVNTKSCLFFSSKKRPGFNYKGESRWWFTAENILGVACPRPAVVTRRLQESTEPWHRGEYSGSLLQASVEDGKVGARSKR